MSRRPRSGTAATTLAVAVVTALLVPTQLAAHAEVDAPPVPQPISATTAEHALRVATAVMAGKSHSLSPTLALRDLALKADRLTGADRRHAEALLARPNQATGSRDGFAAWKTREAAASRNGKGCSLDPQTPICVHWTKRSADAPDPKDSDHDGVPNWAEVTLAEMEHVWDYEVNTLGFRKPMTDQRGSKDNDGVFFDVYLSDIGSRYYGYCAIDDSHNRRNYNFKDRSGYCVLDDDYAKSQFRAHSPRENLQVTAAHEFFHAIQFAYDASEDLWFMEGGAAWIEDEVYDHVNDNRQYLATSQFRHPRQPLDNNRGIGVYGTWGFLRYLSERFGTEVIRRSWQRADGSPGGPDDYSLVALRHAVTSEGADLNKVLGTFGLVVADPNAFLSEGKQFPARTVDGFRLDRDRDSTKWRRYSLDHLSYAPIEFRPGDRVRRGDRLHISVDAPRRGTHPEVRAMVVRRNGSVSGVRNVHLNRHGNGSIRIGFGDSHIRKVLLSMANTSTDFRRCFSHSTSYSCHGGIPRDERQRYWFKAVLR
ncbi:MAG: MXAN_6640 family putative metalloprotease [Actinomycetes bacterium]